LTNYNGDFENGLTNWRFFEVPNALGSTAQISSSVVSGTKAVMITYVATDGTLQDRGFDNWTSHPPVIGGQVYNLKAFLRSDQLTGLYAKVTLGFFDAAHNVVGSQSKVVALTSIYSEFSFQALAPVNSVYCWIAFRLNDVAGNKVAGNIYIDNVQLYKTQFTDILNPSIDPNPVIDYTQWKIEKGKFFIGGKWTFLKIAKPLVNYTSEIDVNKVIASLDTLKKKHYNTIEIICYWKFFDTNGDGIIDKSLVPLNNVINAIYNKGMYPCIGVEMGSVGGGSLVIPFWINHPDAQAVDDKGNLVTDTEYGFNAKVVSIFHQGYKDASHLFIKNLASGIDTKKILYFETSVEPQYMGSINLDYSISAKLEYERWRIANNITDDASKMPTSFPIPTTFINNPTWNKFRAQALADWVNNEAAAYRSIAGSSAYVAVDYLDANESFQQNRVGDPIEFLTSLTTPNIIQVNWHWSLSKNSPNQKAYDRVWQVINAAKRDWAVSEHMTFNGSDFSSLNDMYLYQVLVNTLKQGTLFGWEFTNVMNRTTDNFCVYNDDWTPKNTIKMVDQNWGYWLNTVNNNELNQSLLSSNTLSLLHQVCCQIYPNPATEYINIQSSNKLQSVSIYSISGQKIKDINSKFDSINISDLLTGTYFVKVNAEGADSIHKLTIK